MAEKILKTRTIQKHDIEANWNNSSIIPQKGELIIYDPDENHVESRFKIGDGVKTPPALSFQNISGPVGQNGKNGVTFTPSVSSAGVISWTNDGGKTNPSSVNIKGPNGVGISTITAGNSTVSGNYTVTPITITKTDTTTQTLNIKAKNGSDATIDTSKFARIDQSVDFEASISVGAAYGNSGSVTIYSEDGNSKVTYTSSGITIKDSNNSGPLTFTFPSEGGVIATTSKIPDISNLAKLNEDNTFTGLNAFNGRNTYMADTIQPNTIVYEPDSNCFTKFSGRWVQVTDTTIDEFTHRTTYRADGITNFTIDSSGAKTSALIKWPTNAANNSVFATTGDIDVTAAGDNIFTGTNTFKTETSSVLYRTLINQNGISVGGGPGSILIDVTYGLDNIKRLYSGTTYTYTFPNKNGMFATMDDIPVVASLAKLAQDNTFTGSNIFEKDITRKTTSGSSYTRTLMSDTGFSVGMGTGSSILTDTIYGQTSITRKIPGNDYTVSLPSRAGTIALTGDIPIKTATLDGTTLSITLN